ncbi:MAG: RHS repeat domain-containing protein, partial [Thermomicrobiales bacterium]
HYVAQGANYHVHAVTNASGTVLERYHYDPYGRLTVLDPDFTPDADNTSDIDNPYTFTGRRFDGESGLYYFRNRTFDQTTARFLSRDPIGMKGDGPSLYVAAFVIDRTDPRGLKAIKCYCDCAHDALILDDQKTIRVDCKGRGDSCCTKACENLHIDCEAWDWDIDHDSIPIPPPPPPASFFGGTRCGYVLMSCPKSGLVFNRVAPVFGHSHFAIFIHTYSGSGSGDGCVTMPDGIYCSRECDELKTWVIDAKGTKILEHEACHMCTYYMDGLIALALTGGPAPDGCAETPVPAAPLW